MRRSSKNCSPMTVERVVIDTSILISAALFGSGKPAAAVDYAVTHCTIIFSRPTFDELATRIMRQKFDRYVSTTERQVYLDKMYATATWVEIPETLAVCRDPDDNKVLETAVSGRAECILTGDHDLRALDPFQGIPIVSAAQFLTLVGK